MTSLSDSAPAPKTPSLVLPSDAERVRLMTLVLLRWLAADKFTFLGTRDYAYRRDASGAFTAEEPETAGADK